MALIVITLHDSDDGPMVAVVSEPAFDVSKPETMVTPAQGVAPTMLESLRNDIKQDRGLIHLLDS